MQTTHFIGRAAERAAVRDLINRHRLVTVVGEPGFPDAMPHIYGTQLSAKQLSDLVQYLAAGPG